MNLLPMEIFYRCDFGFQGLDALYIETIRVFWCILQKSSSG